MDFPQSVGLIVVALSMFLSAYSYKTLWKSLKSTFKLVLTEQDSIVNSCYKPHEQKVKEFVSRGRDASEKLLHNAKFQKNPIFSKENFLEWLRCVAKRRLRTDKEFINRVALRNLRKSHKSILQAVESTEKSARKAFNKTENAQRIYSIEHTLEGSSHAVRNMKKFVNYGISEDIAFHNNTNINEPDSNIFDKGNELAITTKNKVKDANLGDTQSQQQAMQLKMDRVRALIPTKELEVERLTIELENLKNETPEYFILQDATSRLKSCYSEIGLDAANDVLKSSQQLSGRSRNERGFSFEDAAEDVLVNYLLPDLAAKESMQVSELVLVRNVKLGMASQKGSTAEIDCLVCVRGAPCPKSVSETGTQAAFKSVDFCRVLAVVEVKRNADDIADAFCSYQQALTWLCGLEGLYDPASWKTRAYPRGHFDRPFIHCSNGENLLFTRESFAGLCRREVTVDWSTHGSSLEHASKSGLGSSLELFIDRLYFVTREAKLESVGSKTMNWVMHHVASSEQFDDELSDECINEVEALRLVVEEKFSVRISAADVVKLYRDCCLDEQLFVVSLQESSAMRTSDSM